ncbi:DUF397 domain-containing protein [Nocardiopsis alba]|uniref:DUF397 domain-containing protein n=1 Tax=Nocardiopsis alba TaxID=53437 RepID=A0A7K2IRI0_9ACTN|nr:MULTISPECIES: DUF397 domain-containing protein [Nocardiopsis]MEC3892661.1 DUF397 domain-containing protein [Nocardiopsis sp. LDBS1602]MYR32414.1 DUF397 domain-containing protein [Nocardiopsis alba]
MPETTHPLNFRKSSYSNPNNCVEVADTPGASAIRDTKRRTDGHLPFPTDEWAAFLTTLTR